MSSFLTCMYVCMYVCKYVCICISMHATVNSYKCINYECMYVCDALTCLLILSILRFNFSIPIKFVCMYI